MASNGTDRGGLLSAGGILSIMAGVFEINAGVIFSLGGCMPWSLWLFPFLPGFWWEAFMSYCGTGITGGFFLALGILAVTGGILAIKTKSFGLSLVGAICALPTGILGILAAIFVALGRREFRAED
jgi:hypothetical protein